MMLLVNENEGAPQQVALAEEMIAGDVTLARVYNADGKFLAVDHPNSEVINHDVNEILRLDGYRLATADEQNSYSGSRKKKSSLVEKSTDAPADSKEGE